MKNRQTNISWRRLIVALLIGGVVPFLSLARNQYGQTVPRSFKYPESQETIRIDAKIESRLLSGIVRDPNGAGSSKVLIERVEPGWGKRLGAVFSNTNGHFAFTRVRSGTHFLRISKPGFNTMLLKVRVSTKIKSTLQIELKLSN